ncbi:hypothetical protein WCX49_10995 [Sulfurimonas sp. HSL-1656]|uniref:hypothetical protein n=1 Tax=Thiomicrolovo subterrani TaxID=3131934 RepID=UPI0031F7CF07
MKRMKMGLLYSAAFVLFLLVFLPKTALYHEAELQMKPFGLAVAAETPVDRGVDFVLKGGDLYFEDLHVARLERITVTPWLFYNSVRVAPFTLSSDMESFAPRSVDGMRVTYSVLDPLHVTLEGSGAFGSVTGQVALLERKITLELTPSAALRAKRPFWLKQLRSIEGGAYRYETTY